MMNTLMRNFLIALCAVGILFSIGSLAHADELYQVTNDLTPAQKAELILKAEELKKKASPMTPSDLEEYANLGQKYGVALASTAKELGKSVDELMNTNVGKIATFLIVWKVLGETVLGFVIGMGWFTVTNSIWLYAFRRLVLQARGFKETVVEGKVTARNYERVLDSDQGATKVVLLIAFFAINILGLIIVF